MGGKSVDDGNNSSGNPALALSKAIGSIGGLFMNAWGQGGGGGRKVSPIEEQDSHILMVSGDGNENTRHLRATNEKNLNSFRSSDDGQRNSVTCVEIQ